MIYLKKKLRKKLVKEPFILIYEGKVEEYQSYSWAIRKAESLKEKRIECQVNHNGFLYFAWARLGPCNDNDYTLNFEDSDSHQLSPPK